MNKRKFGIVYAIAIVIVLGLVLYFSLKDNFKEIIDLITNINVKWIILSILLLFIYRFLGGTSIYLLVKNSKENISIWKTFQLNFITLFFNGITPFATGGQPMTVYYLHKENISVEKSTNIVLQNFIMYQTALILVGLITILYNHFNPIFPFNSFMRRLVVLGFLINFGVWLVTFLLAFGKKSVTGILERIIKLLHRMGIIRNLDKYLKKLDDMSSRFYGSAINLLNNKKVILKSVLANVLSLLSLYSIPFVLTCGLEINDISVWDCIVATSYVMIMGSFVPIPGGTGGIEYGFMYFFKYLINGSVLSALMLVWRFITYYIGIITGAIFLIFYRKKSKVWLKKEIN